MKPLSTMIPDKNYCSMTAKGIIKGNQKMNPCDLIRVAVFIINKLKILRLT